MPKFKLSPPRIVLISYLALILIGTLLLILPFSTTRDISFLDALFTATSAVTVTGLIVLDTGKDFTPVGQLIILLLIQIGGLGYMTFTTFFLVSLRRRIGLKDRLILAEALNYPGLHGLVRFLKRTVIFVLLAELLGAILLFLDFIRKFPLQESIFYAIFHSISAFNNAGFSVFSNNLADFKGDYYVQLVVMALIILGGLGFFVISDLYFYFKGEVRRLSTHTKLVLSMSGILIILGTLGFFFTEYGHKSYELPFIERFFNYLFTSVSARTAGFNTLDLSLMSESSLFLIMILMFIGASPGGTGGGIKTTTFAVILIAVIRYVRGEDEVVIFERKIRERQIHRAMVILSLSMLYITFVNFLLDKFEEKDFLATFFEVVSAFSTVGLSLGNGGNLSFVAEFSPIGKLLIIITMIVGRVGILSFMIALIRKEKKSALKYPEARILL